MSISIDRAAALLGRSRRTVYNRIQRGQLITISIGQSKRVTIESLRQQPEWKRGRALLEALEDASTIQHPCAEVDGAAPPKRVNSFEQRLLLETRANVLLVGAEPTTTSMINILRRRTPDLRTQLAATMRLKQVDAPTLILRHVDCLKAHQQIELMTWLDGRPAVRIISTARESLMPLLDAGQFLMDLYYRLNVVYLDLNAGTRAWRATV